MLLQQRCRDFASRLIILLLAGAACWSGCGGGGGPPPEPTALLVGAASGPIYDDLASAYHVSSGTGSESPAGYDLLIYDGESLTPEQIESLPSTNNFLNASKIVVVLSPSILDLRALETELGAAPLTDTAAVAVFKSFSSGGGLQNSTVVEFPATLSENPSPPADSSAATSLSDADQPASAHAYVDDADLTLQADQWRALFEQQHAQTTAALGDLAAVSGAQFAAAEEDDTGGPSAMAAADPASLEEETDPSSWLAAPQNVPPASTSPFWTVRQFTETKPEMFQMKSAVYDPANQKPHYDGTIPINRGLCFFLPDQVSFSLKPAVFSSATVLITHVVNRLLQQTNGTTYNHNIIARQFIKSSPAVLRPDVGQEDVSFCRALASGGFPPFHWYCTDNGFGCNRFSEVFPLQSWLGFNEQITSTQSWDPTSAALLSVNSLRPLAANKVSTVTTSEKWSLGVNWSIQGTLDVEVIPPNVGVSLGSVGGSANWAWETSQNISIADWETKPLATGSTAIHDLFAAAGPNNLANLQAFSSTTGSGVLSYTTLSGLQQSFLDDRTESNWITTRALLPAAKAILTSQVNVNYGEVYDLYSAVKHIDPAPLPYGALHAFTVTLPMEFDFSQPILQPPLRPTWTITAELTTPANRQGFFPVKGTVTLDRASSILDTIIDLGAELYNFGSGKPEITVIKNLPTEVVIPAGSLSSSFNFLVQRIGSPYNVRVWAFQSQGQQTGYPMTVPAS